MAKKCTISSDLQALKGIYITDAEDITVTVHKHSQKGHRKGGWTLAQIIEFAAFKVKEKNGEAYGDWHEHIFLEEFVKVDHATFKCEFGS